jgi:alcohol dehydrogenase class IV
MRAIDHAVESVLADNAHPYVDTLALAGLEILGKKLVTGIHEPDRVALLGAAWMAHAGSYHINWGLSHRMGRLLGARFDIPHGYTSAIFLHAVVALESPRKPAAVAEVGRAMGVPADGVPGALRSLAERMNLPVSLRQAGLADRAPVEQLFAGDDAALAVVDRVW